MVEDGWSLIFSFKASRKILSRCRTRYLLKPFNRWVAEVLPICWVNDVEILKGGPRAKHAIAVGTQALSRNPANPKLNWEGQDLMRVHLICNFYTYIYIYTRFSQSLSILFRFPLSPRPSNKTFFNSILKSSDCRAGGSLRRIQL